MKLYERVPDCVTVDGRRIKCDFDFRNVLRMLDIMQHDDIIPDARDYLCAKCVVRHKIRYKTALKAYKAITALLFGVAPETGENSGKRLTSYEQDAPLIRAAFLQVYGINLFHDRLSWFEFRELLQGLPEGNRYEEIIGIRARPLPAPTKYNQKEREWLMQAKQACALHLTEREQARKYEEDAGKVFAGLMGMIRRAQEKEVIDNGE